MSKKEHWETVKCPNCGGKPPNVYKCGLCGGSGLIKVRKL